MSISNLIAGRHHRAPLLLSLLLLLSALPMAVFAATPAESAPEQAPSDRSAQAAVFAAERAFARSMADRDLEAFAAHIAEDAIFFSQAGALRGRPAVVAHWKAYFDGPQAPFAWAPDEVEVLPTGALAHSSGPVTDPAGEVIARFNSVWRLDPDGRWRVVFDRGSPVCRGQPTD